MADARIFDRGYRHYDGPRLGPLNGYVSIGLHSLKRVLGLRRPARAKALPVIVIAIAYVPAIVIVGVAAFVEDAFENDLPTYAGYYGTIYTAILLFVTFVTPEALCPDRRTRLLSQYLAAPVTRAGYLIAKAASVFVVLATVTLGPQLLLLIALSLENAGPNGVDGWFATLGRILASGVFVSLMLTVVSLAVSSFTDRKAFASVGFIVFVLVTGVAADALYEDGDGNTWAALFNLTGLPLEVVLRIFAVPADCFSFTGSCDKLIYPDLSTPAVVAGSVAWIALATAVLWSRYRRIEVS
jgi:ABC-2 type transport system permease protein